MTKWVRFVREVQVALIAPYPELAEIAQRVVTAFDLPVAVHTGDLQEGVKAATDAVNAGAHVIISRGGTALAIRQALGKPVVEIPVSAYDVLRAVHRARNHGGRIGVVGFENVVLGAQGIGPILGLKITEVPLHSESEIERIVSDLSKSGVEAVVGDAIAVKTAEAHGIPGELVTSGQETVLAACQEALRVLDVWLQEQAWVSRLRAILGSVGEGILALDEHNEITLANPEAARLLGYPEEELTGRQISRIAPDLHPARSQDLHGNPQGRVLRHGSLQLVANFFPYPVGERTSGVVITLQDVQQLQRAESRVRRALLARGHTARTTLDDIVGASPPMSVVISQARAFAATNSVILITGETGTGKELLAQGVHNASARRSGPFVAINCAALPSTLLDSELFGYVEGAFTDARKGGKMGLFEQAHLGTIFLDEIGELPLEMQGRLLRVLQEREVMRIGGDRIVPVDVRVIAATNVNLVEAVRAGRFRQDLFYRLNVLHLHLPPLRERTQDIPHIARALLSRLAARQHKAVPEVSPEALAALQAYPWPGNVRELENVVERLLAVAPARITEEHVRAVGIAQEMAPTVRRPAHQGLTRERVLAALEQAGRRRIMAAAILGVSRSTLWRLMREYHLL
ncbi:MAG: sigma 54-interacting transcriptional regulator [Bacillota bacterium]